MALGNQYIPPKSGDFIVGSIGADGKISFSEKPRVHSDEEAARSEASRLVKANTFVGRKFIVAKLVGVAQASQVAWS